jgi:hypothetical protein
MGDLPSTARRLPGLWRVKEPTTCGMGILHDSAGGFHAGSLSSPYRGLRRKQGSCKIRPRDFTGRVKIPCERGNDGKYIIGMIGIGMAGGGCFLEGGVGQICVSAHNAARPITRMPVSVCGAGLPCRRPRRLPLRLHLPQRPLHPRLRRNRPFRRHRPRRTPSSLMQSRHISSRTRTSSDSRFPGRLGSRGRTLGSPTPRRPRLTRSRRRGRAAGAGCSGSAP